MPNVQTPFAKRVAAERLTFADVSELTGISVERLTAHSKGKGTLRPEELARIDSLLISHFVVHKAWRSAAEAAAAGFKAPQVTAVA